MEINNYLGFEVTKKSTEVTDELIDEEIEKVRDRNSRMVTVEDRPVANGDIAVIDFEGFVDGVAFDGGKAENYNLTIGSGNFIPGFEEQIIGHSTDEEFSINVKFPEEYQAEELAGKDAEFKIKLHEIKAKELPEVDDEFVKDVSEKETVAEYRDELKETIAARLEDEAEKDKDNQIAEKLIELLEGEIPQAMYDNQVNEMVRDFEMRIRSQGIDMNTYLQYMGIDLDGLKKMYADEAKKRVQLRLALETIAKKENIEVTDADLDEAYNKMVATSIDVSGATLDSPADMTSMLQSPSFSEVNGDGETVGTIQGWTTNGNQYAMSANNYEFYNLKEADIHQTVYGLPKGYYRLAFDGLYRAGDAIPAALSRREGKEPQNALVYAESGEGKWNEPLASIFEGMGEYKYTTGDQVLPDSLFPESKALYHIIVNNVSGADLTFQEGLYAGDFSFYVSETGQPVTIGVRKDSLVANDWAVFDNFTLLYYGDGDANKPDDFESAIDGVTAEGKAKIASSAWYTLDGVRVKEPRQRGIYIRQDLMDDGTRKAIKVMVR